MSAIVPAQPRRSLLPWLFLLGLAIVVAVNLILVWFAVRTFPGVTTRNAYEEGRRYGRVLEADAARAAMGWNAEARWLTSGAIEVRYRDHTGQPVTGLSPQAVATRPVGDQVRVVLSLQAVMPGVYRASVVLPHRGQWDVRVIASEQPQAHQFTKRVTVP
jgi:nitrogen fixation protein FixH